MKLYNLKCIMWWFDTCIYFKIITTIKLVKTFIPSHTYNIFVAITCKIYCLNNFQVIVGTTLYMRAPELTHFISESLSTFTNISPLPLHVIPWQPLFYFLFYELDFFRSENIQYLSFSIVPSKFIYVVTKHRIFFFMDE